MLYCYTGKLIPLATSQTCQFSQGFLWLPSSCVAYSTQVRAAAKMSAESVDSPYNQLTLWVTLPLVLTSSEDIYCGISHLLHLSEWYGKIFHSQALFSLALALENKLACWWNILSYHTLTHIYIYNILYICDHLQENRAQRGVRKYWEKIDRFL